MQTLLNEALKHKFEASGSTSMQHKATTLQEEQDIHLVEDSRMQERFLQFVHTTYEHPFSFADFILS